MPFSLITEELSRKTWDKCTVVAREGETFTVRLPGPVPPETYELFGKSSPEGLYFRALSRIRSRRWDRSFDLLKVDVVANLIIGARQLAKKHLGDEDEYQVAKAVNAAIEKLLGGVVAEIAMNHYRSAEDIREIMRE